MNLIFWLRFAPRAHTLACLKSCHKELQLTLLKHEGSRLKEVNFQHTVTAFHWWVLHLYTDVYLPMLGWCHGKTLQNTTSHFFNADVVLFIYPTPKTKTHKAKVYSHLRDSPYWEKALQTELLHHRKNWSNQWQKLPDTKENLFHKSATSKSQARSPKTDLPCSHVSLPVSQVLNSPFSQKIWSIKSSGADSEKLHLHSSVFIQTLLTAKT